MPATDSDILLLIDEVDVELKSLLATGLIDAQGVDNRAESRVFESIHAKATELVGNAAENHQITPYVSKSTVVSAYNRLRHQLSTATSANCKVPPAPEKFDRSILIEESVQEIRSNYILWPKKSFLGAASAVLFIVISLTGLNLWTAFGPSISSARIEAAELRAEAAAAKLEEVVEATIKQIIPVTTKRGNNHGSQAP